MGTESKEIFISHSVADKNIADAICDLLVTGMGVNAENMIFCSSLEGLGIPSGSNFVDFIKDKMQNTKLVILVLTERYFISQFCLAELGASWIQSKKAIPLIVPPLEYSNMEAVLTGIHARVINEKTSWNEIADEMKTLLSLSFNHSRWERKRDDFLVSITPILDAQVKPEIVKIEHFKKIEDDYKDACDEIKELNDNLKQKQKYIDQLEKLKDNKAVDELKRGNMGEWEEFELLCEDVKKALNDIPSIVKDALFYEKKGESLSTEWTNYLIRADIQEASDCNMLICEKGEPVWANQEHPRVRNANDLLVQLEQFMRENSGELRTIIEKKYKISYDLADKDFWSEFLQ